MQILTNNFVEVLRAAIEELGVAPAPYTWRRLCRKAGADANRLIEYASQEFSLHVITEKSCRNRCPTDGVFIVKNCNDIWHLGYGSSNGIRCDVDEINEREPIVWYHLRAAGSFRSWSSFLFPARGKERSLAIRLLATTGGIHLFGLVLPLYLNAIYDRVVPAAAQPSLWVLSAGVILALTAEYIVRIYRNNYAILLGDRLTTRLSEQFAAEIAITPPNLDNRWGNDVVKVLAKLKQLPMSYWSIVSGNCLDIVFCGLSLLLVAVISGWLAAIPALVLIAGLLIICVSILQAEQTVPADKEIMPTSDKMFYYTAVNRNDIIADIWLVRSEREGAQRKTLFQVQGATFARLLALTGVQSVAIVVAGFYLIQAGKIGLAALFPVILLASRTIQPLFSLVSVLPAVQQSVVNLKIARPFMNRVAPMAARGGLREKSSAGWQLSEAQFRYDQKVLAIKGLTLQIAQGEKIALLGGSGSGKTTLLRLLSGVVSRSMGLVCWNGGEMDVVGEELRNKIHTMWQSPEIIGSSLREFLTLEGHRDEHLIRSAMEFVGLAHLCDGIEPVIDYRLTNNSITLSPSHIQRLFIARLWLSERPILLLDAPGDFLNPFHERLLKKILLEKSQKGVTIIFASDRTNLLSLADRVVVLDAGTIAFDGPREAFVKLREQQN